MKNKKLILVGPTTQNNTLLNGQSMMFQLLVDELIKRKIDHTVIDIGKTIFKNKNNISGKFSIKKLFDYCCIIIKLIYKLFFGVKSNIYLTTAQSKVGFLRDFIIIRIALIFGCKVFVHQFGANYSGFYNSQKVFFKWLISSTLNKTKLIIVEGEFTKQQFNFIQNFESKVLPLPNGLPQKIDQNNINPKTLRDQNIKLFYLSNMIESKGYWDVLEAVKILINEYKIKIDVVFSGRFLDAVDDVTFRSATEAKIAFFEFIKTNGLEKNITYFDGLFGEKKEYYFNRSHFFILPSYYINEGQPVSIVEALAYGCVPIVTNYRLIPTMVSLKNGVFVKPKSPKEIAIKIHNLIKDYEQYDKLSKACINTYLENFTAEKYTNKLIDILLSE